MTAGLQKVAILAATLWATCAALTCTDSGIGMLWFLVVYLSGLGLIAFWLIRLLVFLVWGRRRGRLPLWSWAIEPTTVAVVVGLVLSGAAFQVRFYVSLPVMTQSVRAVQATGPTDSRFPPSLVGLFLVRETETLPGGIVRLITTSCGFDDCGVVYSPAGKPPVVGEDSYVALGAGWWQWHRSW